MSALVQTKNGGLREAPALRQSGGALVGGGVQTFGLATVAAGLPAFSFEWVGGERSRVFIMEPGSTNQLDDSVALDRYNGANVVVTATDGRGQQAWTIADDAAGGTGIAGLVLTEVYNAGANCLAVVARSDQSEWLLARCLNFTDNPRAWFDLSSGVANVDGQAGTLDGGMVDLGDGWWLCWLAFDPGADTNGSVYLCPADGNGTIITTRDGTHSVTVTEARVVDLAAPVTSLATYGAAASRATDALSFPAPAAFEPMTMYARFVEAGALSVTNAGLANVGIVDLSFNANNRFTIEPRTAGIYRARYRDGTNGQFVVEGGNQSIEVGDVVELAATIAADGTVRLRQSVNGSVISDQTGGGGFMPLLTIGASLTLGGFAGGLCLASFLDVDLYSGDRDLAHCRSQRGDLFSFRPSEGDTVDAPGVGLAGTFSRPSAATYTARDPLALPDGAPGSFFINPFEAFQGGRVPVRDHQGNVVNTVHLIQGIDDTVGTSNPALTGEGWGVTSGDSLRLNLTGALDLTRTSADIGVVLTTVDTQAIVVNRQDTSAWLFMVRDGSNSSITNGAGSPSTLVDGSLLATATADGLHAAIADGSPHLVEATGCDLSSWTAIRFNTHGGSWVLDGTLGPLVLAPAGRTQAERALDHARLRAMLAQAGATPIPALP